LTLLDRNVSSSVIGECVGAQGGAECLAGVAPDLLEETLGVLGVLVDVHVENHLQGHIDLDQGGARGVGRVEDVVLGGGHVHAVLTYVGTAGLGLWIQIVIEFVQDVLTWHLLSF